MIAWTIYALINKDGISVLRITKCFIIVTQNEVKKQVYLPNVLLTARLTFISDRGSSEGQNAWGRNSKYCSISLKQTKHTHKRGLHVLLMWLHFHEAFLCCLDFFSLFLSAWPTEHCCLFDQWRMACASSEETDRPLTCFPTVAPPPHPEKTGSAAWFNTLHHTAFSLMAKRKAAAPQRLCVMTAEVSACLRSPFQRIWRGRWKRAPTRPLLASRVPRRCTLVEPLSCAAQSQLAFIISDINLQMKWRYD